MILLINGNDYEFQSIKNAINYFKINSESDICIKDAYFLRTSDNLPEKEVSLTNSQVKELEYRINTAIEKEQKNKDNSDENPAKDFYKRECLG